MGIFIKLVLVLSVVTLGVLIVRLFDDPKELLKDIKEANNFMNWLTLIVFASWVLIMIWILRPDK